MNYFLVETKTKGEEGINGGLMQRKMPGQPFINYVDVASIDAALKKVEGAGGIVIMPKAEIAPGVGWIAAFKDTEGNIMGFHQSPPKPAAKSGSKKTASKKPAAKKRDKK
jgi:predicted enzyme related to lactoylglutathione lyase